MPGRPKVSRPRKSKPTKREFQDELRAEEDIEDSSATGSSRKKVRWEGGESPREQDDETEEIEDSSLSGEKVCPMFLIHSTSGVSSLSVSDMFHCLVSVVRAYALDAFVSY